MEKQIIENRFEHLIEKVIFRHIEELKKDESSETIQRILDRSEHLELAKVIFEYCQNEKIMKAKIKFLEHRLIIAIQKEYLPKLTFTENIDTSIRKFNKITKILKNQQTFLDGFFKNYNSTSAQKYLFLDSKIEKTIDELYFDMLIRPNDYQLFNIIKQKILQFDISNFFIDDEFIFFLITLQNFGSKKKVEVFELYFNYAFFDAFKEKVDVLISGMQELKNESYYKKLAEFRESLQKFIFAHFSKIILKPAFQSKIINSSDEQIAKSSEPDSTESAILLNEQTSQHIRLNDVAGEIIANAAFLALRNDKFTYFLSLIDTCDVQNLTIIWKILKEPEIVLKEFKLFFMEFLINMSFFKIQDLNKTTFKIDDLVNFHIKIKNVIIECFEDNQSIRFSRNKALEEFMNERNCATQKINFSSFYNAIFVYLKEKIIELNANESEMLFLIELIGYLNPKIFKNGMSDFFIRLVLTSNPEELFFAHMKSILDMFLNKLGEECVQPALNAFREAKHSKLNQKNETHVQIMFLNKIEGFNHLKIKTPALLTSIVNDISNSLLEETTKGLKTMELDFDNGLMEVEFSVKDEVYQLVSNPVICSTLMSIGLANKITFDELLIDLFEEPKNESSKKQIIQKLEEILHTLKSTNLIFQSDQFYCFNMNFEQAEKCLNLHSVQVIGNVSLQDIEENLGRNAEMESRIMRKVKINPNIELFELYKDINKEISNFKDNVFRQAVEYLVRNDLLHIVSTDPVKLMIK